MLLGFSFLVVSTHAIEPPSRIGQYGHTAWRLEDGYFQSSPQTIAQTMDGYLWFGTPTGALRFDGVKFTKFSIPPGKKVSVNTVSLLGSSDGNLWLGTAGGLVRSYKGAFTFYPQLDGQIDDIIEDHNHRVWIVRAHVARAEGPLCEITGDSALCHGKAEGIAKGYAVALAEATDHTLWIAHSDSLSHWSGTAATTLPISGLDHLRGLGGIRSTLANDDGSVWIGMSSIGPGLGLQREVDGELRSLRLVGFDSEQISVSALMHDADGALWIGTESDGLYRIKNGIADHYRSADGLSSDAVYSLFEDKERNVWVATSSGVDRFRSLRVTTFSIRDGLSADNIGSVLAARDGTVWIGNHGALDNIRGTKVTSIRPRNGLPGEMVTSLSEDRKGLLWVGVDNTLATYDGKRFSPIVGVAGKYLGVIRSIVQDANDEDMYALAVKDSHDHLLRIRERRVIDDVLGPEVEDTIAIAADPVGGILVSTVGLRLRHWSGGPMGAIREYEKDPHGGLSSVIVDSDGIIWGATGRGLVGIKAGQRSLLDETRGLPCSTVEEVLEDKHEDLWLHMPCGLVVITREEVRKLWADSSHAAGVRTLSVFDGYFSGTSSFSPKISLGSDGRIWSMNGQVVQVIDPASLTLNTFQPPIHIEQIVADQIPYALSGKVRLPALLHNLEIDYTGLSLSVPQKVNFRYRLAGFEQAWQEAGTRRQAFYTNLRPGRYVFQVLATNADGVWSKTGDSTIISVAPAFYQTTWFAILIAASGLFLFYLIYLARLRFLTAQVQTRMMDRLAERERIARDLHDTFFQSIQGLLLRFNTGTSKMNKSDPARAIFLETLEKSDKAMLEGRELLLDLRATLDPGELEVLFAQAGDELQPIHAAAFKVTVLGQPFCLHPLAATELYRLGKEALHNAFSHSCGTHIEIELEYAPEALKLRVRDDGHGLDGKIMHDGMRKGHWGLPGMHERANKIGGRLTVWSKKDNGTEIEVVVPAGTAYSETNTRLSPAWLQRLLRKTMSFGRHPKA